MDEDFQFQVYKNLAISEARFCILDIINEFRNLSNNLNLDIFNSKHSEKLLCNYIGKYCFVFIDCFN